MKVSHGAKKKISIIVPVFNESEASIKGFMNALTPITSSLLEFKWEIIFVDDSNDVTCIQTLKRLAQEYNFKVVFFSRNFGKESAVRAGLYFSQGDAVIPIDVDLQDPIELIPVMIERWLEGNDMILAKRIDRKSDSGPKRFWAAFFYKLMGKLAEVRIPENVGDFRLMDKRVKDAVLSMPERNIFLKGIYSWVGFKSFTIEFSRPARYSGESKFPFRRLVKIAIDGVVSFSSISLRIWSYIGFLIAFLTTMFSIYLISQKIINDVAVPGYTSLMVIILFSTSLNLICFGVFGEYLARIFIETKQRPHYLIQELYNFPDSKSLQM